MRNKIKIALSFVFLFLFLFPSIFTANAENDINELDYIPPATAGSVYLYSYNGDRVIFSNAQNKRIAPGAAAKMMAGLVACEMYSERFDETVTLSAEMLQGVSGTSMNLRAGMTLTLRDLFYGTVCGANNDAAQALAIALCGSVEAFVKEMNYFASLLYMKNTLFTDPTGLDDVTAYTTPEDVALLAHKAARVPAYLDASSKQFFEATLDNGSSITVYNRNALVSQFSSTGYVNKDAKGLIAGRTDNGGHLLAAIAEKNGESFLCVIMGAQASKDTVYSYETANYLFDLVFYDYASVKVADKGREFLSSEVGLSVIHGKDDPLSFVLEEDLYVFIREDTDLKANITFKPYLHDTAPIAPIRQGEILGGVDVYLGDTLIATAPLVAKNEVEPNSILYILETMKGFFLSGVFIIGVILSVLLILVYLYFESSYRRSKRIKGVYFRNERKGPRRRSPRS